MGKKRGPLLGVQDRNHTAIEATTKRRAAIREDMIIATAYRREPLLCIHVPYHSFRKKVRAMAEKQNRPLREAANAWVDNWIGDRTRWQRTGSQSTRQKFRVLPDGKKVFYT
jgi:hypothetical protein